jgi:hyperosmotically inducible protein
METRFLRKLCLFSLVVSLICLAACGSDSAAETQMEEQISAAERQIDDGAITTAVKSKLAADVRLSTLVDVSVETESGVVTLSGMVPSEEIKQAAEDVAATIDGAVRVSNQLRVEPPAAP